MFYKLIKYLFKDFYIFSAAYSNNIFPDPLSKEDEEKYIARAKTGDIEARNKLIEHNLRLVAHIVKKYENKMQLDTKEINRRKGSSLKQKNPNININNSINEDNEEEIKEKINEDNNNNNYISYLGNNSSRPETPKLNTINKEDEKIIENKNNDINIYYPNENIIKSNKTKNNEDILYISIYIFLIIKKSDLSIIFQNSKTII